PDQARLRPIHPDLHLDHVVHGNAFRDRHHDVYPRIDAFEDRVCSKRRRNENRTRTRTRLADRLRHGIENRDRVAPMREFLPSLSRSYTRDDTSPVVEGKLSVTRTKAAGDALDENL